MLSNTATPKYYGEFRDKVIRGEIPVCREVEAEMNRIDRLIASRIITMTTKLLKDGLSFVKTNWY